MRFLKTSALILALVITGTTLAHDRDHPSIHDKLATLIERLKKEFPQEKLLSMSREDLVGALTPEEKDAFGTGHVRFRVNVPVVVSVIRDSGAKEEPYWLKERGFKPTGVHIDVEGTDFDVWEKGFDAGEIGLGINSFTGSPKAYFVALRPQKPGDEIQVTDFFPAQYRVGRLENGAHPYSDDTTVITSVPKELEGSVLVRCPESRRREAKLIHTFHKTPYPSSEKPDLIVLTWSEDPKTTQTIQWRTNVSVTKGEVAYQKKSEFNNFFKRPPTTVQSEVERMETPTILNDPVVNHHTVVLRDLEPGTTYVYSVGNGTENGWTEVSEFTTAPEGVVPFSFTYMGDAQNGLERWGTLVQNSYRKRPDTSFYILAGDLVNRGAERDDWDSFLQNAEGVFDRKQFVPALGNHEYQGGEPRLYLEQFALPTNGSPNITPEKSYSFTYSNALFVVLDSNLPPETQSDWLEERLSGSNATWKFVIYHHPAYSSGRGRDNPEIREVWGNLFDKYHVDLALQGHDHAYLRTYPMKGGERVATPADGTIYIVSVSGTKYYDQESHDYTEFGMTRVSTYQVFDIQISGDRLVYRAFDIDNDLRDHFTIER